MQKNKTHILSTMSLPQSLIDEAAGKDMVIDELSFIDIKPIVDASIIKKIKEFSTQPLSVVFTSSHAASIVLNSLGNNKPAWDIYSMAGNTKKILADYFGEPAIISTGKNALSLAEKIIQQHTKEVIFFCGNLRRDELPVFLSQHGITVNEIIIYETELTPHTVTKTYNGILFFSPSAVNSFFSANQPGKETILFAIGDATADAIKKYSQNKTITSDLPGKEILVAMAVEYFQTAIYQ